MAASKACPIFGHQSSGPWPEAMTQSQGHMAGQLASQSLALSLWAKGTQTMLEPCAECQ